MLIEAEGTQAAEQHVVDGLQGLAEADRPDETAEPPNIGIRPWHAQKSRDGPRTLRGRVDWHGSDGFGGTVAGANRANREP